VSVVSAGQPRFCPEPINPFGIVNGVFINSAIVFNRRGATCEGLEDGLVPARFHPPHHPVDIMNSPSTTRAVAGAALFAAIFSTAVQAQTGRPSEAPSDRPVALDAKNEEVGSYARYLMLNGMPRDEAIKTAINIDNPAPARHFALRATRTPGEALSYKQAPSAPAAAPQ